MNILGISAFYHDSAACLIQDGRIVAAASEERFTRKKADHEFPINAARYCLEAGGITSADLDYVGFYDKPLIKFERILYTYMATFPKSFPSFMKALPLWLTEKLWIPLQIRKKLDYKGPILFAEHHDRMEQHVDEARKQDNAAERNVFLQGRAGAVPDHQRERDGRDAVGECAIQRLDPHRTHLHVAVARVDGAIAFLVVFLSLR